MHPTPPESTSVRYLLENPWPLGLFLLGIAVVGVVLWHQRGGRLPALIAAGGLLSSIGVFTLEALWETSGEASRALVEQLVHDAEDADVEAVLGAFMPGARLHVGSFKTPPRFIDDIHNDFQTLRSRNRIEVNSITRLRAISTTSNTAQVELSCVTRTSNSMYQVPTTWVFSCRRAEDGSMRLWRVLFESVMGKTPSRAFP